jgi:hypothetical protein
VSTRFSPLERNILEVKGVTGEHLARMEQVGIASLADFATVADAATLAELVALPPEVAEKVMAWAAGARAAQLQGGTRGADVVVESADAVYCAHCKTRQPKDYKAGDLCVACGKQAEPIFACYWCGIAGPGRFCRGCGAEFVHTSELELAIQLRRDGLAKDEIPARLRAMSPADKDALWGLVRRRGSR